MEKTWVVAAESSRARVFVSENRVSPLIELEDFAHTDSRAKDQEIVSDKPGRGFDGVVEGRHGFEKQSDAKHHEALVFAKRLAERIEQGRARGEFEALVLIAAPEFLGMLRHELSAPTARMVVKTIDKNLVQKPEADIRGYVFT
ncbi:host attachment protein [Methylolobus aquaticus]